MPVPSTSITRVCAALIREDFILMVQHKEAERLYWTLPGGGVEPGETPEQAVVREVLEETRLAVTVDRALWDGRFGTSPDVRERCFLVVEHDGTEPVLGEDPEQAHLPPASRMLCGVGWKSLETMRDDIQVSRVLAAMQ